MQARWTQIGLDDVHVPSLRYCAISKAGFHWLKKRLISRIPPPHLQACHVQTDVGMIYIYIYIYIIFMGYDIFTCISINIKHKNVIFIYYISIHVYILYIIYAHAVILECQPIVSFT
jgi:cellulose synthase/poly-beta-1,6-N-acetylglucosamine synthase-like glycosyltransferase